MIECYHPSIGEAIYTFDSVEATPYPDKESIRKALAGELEKACGYAWRFQGEDRGHDPKAKPKLRAIEKYDLVSGLTLQTFFGYDGLPKEEIGRCCKGRLGSFGGFGYRYEGSSKGKGRRNPSRERPIESFDPVTGEVVTTYNNVNEVPYANKAYIVRVLEGKGPSMTAHSLGWRFVGEERTVDFDNPVEAYNLADGQTVATYPSPSRTPYDKSVIYRCLRGTRSSAKGLGWRPAGSDKGKTKEEQRIALRRRKNIRRVAACDPETGEVKAIYASSSQTPYSKSAILKCLRGDYRQSNGFVWRYVDEV